MKPLSYYIMLTYLPLAIVIGSIHIYYMARAFLWLYLWAVSVFEIDRKRAEKIPALKSDDLPAYTIISALYKESQMVESLLHNISRIKYPAHKLQVILALEADDKSTINVSEELIAVNNYPFEILVSVTPAPKKGEYKTKPRALNHALSLTTGEFLVIYDAEDEPDQMQLIDAAESFRASDRNVVCLQACLNYKNNKENWLARMFSMEYSFWFDGLVAGLCAENMPVPLGGTSNHIRTQELKDMGGWDPKNVTEDCELGLRFAEAGYQVGWLDSTTWEEACCTPWAWIKQRTRWSKGYLYTWKTKASPNTLRGQVSWHLFVLGTPLVALINPILWGLFAYYFTGHDIGHLFPYHWMIRASLFCFISGNMICMVLPAYAMWERGRKIDSLLCLTLPVYWFMHTIAAYRGLIEVFTKPHFWAKTDHGISKRDDRVIA